MAHGELASRAGVLARIIVVIAGCPARLIGWKNDPFQSSALLTLSNDSQHRRQYGTRAWRHLGKIGNPDKYGGGAIIERPRSEAPSLIERFAFHTLPELHKYGVAGLLVRGAGERPATDSGAGES